MESAAAVSENHRPAGAAARTARRALSAIALGLGLGLFLTAWFPPATRTKHPAGRPDTCVAPAGAKVQDVDPEDSPVKPWQKPDGSELVVEFETGQLSARYAGMVTEAAAIWSKSPCLNAVAVQTCSSGANCVAVTEDGGRSRNTDGEMDWQGDGDYMESCNHHPVYAAVGADHRQRDPGHHRPRNGPCARPGPPP